MSSFGKKIVIHAVLLTAAALSTTAGALTPADQQEIQSFKLSEDFLHRYEAVIAVKPSEGSEEPSLAQLTMMTSSLDAMTAEAAKSPKLVALLKQHGLSARQAIVGGLVIARAGMADTMLADPKMAKYVSKDKMPSAENMAFYRAHKAEIGEAMKKADAE
jgi:hypothetical protein